MEEEYWTGKYLLDQIKSKILSIVEALYLGYKLLFLFDNTTNHTIYTKNLLKVAYMNNGQEDQQLFL